VRGLAFAALFALLVWWLSTALILHLDRLGRRALLRSMAVVTVLLLLSFYEIGRHRNDATTTGAYLAFLCGLVAWGWLEMSFLFGYLTGTRRHGCGAHCGGWRHFLHAVQAIIWHELAIIVMVFIVFALGTNGTNHTAFWTLLVLWAMRTSAKLNLFLGVRNLSDELLPSHLLYLRSFFRRRPMNLLFPFSVTAATVALVFLVQRMLRPDLTEALVTEAALLAALTALGLLEHWALVLPLPTVAMWQWSLPSRERTTQSPLT
jgi:putative photosynthetic complex assembly protein 2